MKRKLVTAMVLLAISKTAAAQITAENIQHSLWETKYESLGGDTVNATLTFDGTGGTYQSAYGTGYLSDVTYKLPLGGSATITGRWSFGGTNGTFTFFVAGNSKPAIFSGVWRTAGRSGKWKGGFAGIVEQDSGLGSDVAPGGPGGEVVYDKSWSYNREKGYYYRKCTFPKGGYQYVIYYESRPDWVYWYNPAKQVFWCACPTVNHSQWGQAIKDGKDLFLIAVVKARDIDDVVLPKAGDNGENFTKGKAQDRDGSEVDLGCPPSDLP